MLVKFEFVVHSCCLFFQIFKWSCKVFFLSRFSLRNIDNSQDSRGRGRLSLTFLFTISTRFTDTYTLAGRLLVSERKSLTTKLSAFKVEMILNSRLLWGLIYWTIFGTVDFQSMYHLFPNAKKFTGKQTVSYQVLAINVQVLLVFTSESNLKWKWILGRLTDLLESRDNVVWSAVAYLGKTKRSIEGIIKLCLVEFQDVFKIKLENDNINDSRPLRQ